MQIPEWTKKFGASLKGQGAFNLVGDIALGLGVSAIIVAVVAYVLSQISTVLPVNSVAQNVTNTALKGTAQYASWYPIFYTVGAAGVVLIIIALVFGRRGSEKV